MKIGKENEKLEFKKTTGELKEGIISICAMLNKHGNGELYFGVRNDGTPLGQDISEKTLRDISQAVANHLEPKIYPKVTEVFIDEKPCIHVEFTGEESPYFAYGRAYIRVADEDKVLSPTELENFIIKKNEWRGVWDSSLSDKTIDDVDDDVLRNYLDRANRAGRIDFPYTNKKEVLHKLGLIDGNKLKNAADVLFVGSRMLEVQMAIFAGTEKLTFIDIKREHGNVTSLVDIAEKYIQSNIRWRVVLDGSIQRKEIPEIPMDAVREALVNSYCHRLYSSSQNNEIAIYSNRVEIYNPGTFPNGLTPQDFLSGHERSIKRNPLLAQLMYYTKDIESFGTGIKRITDACKEAGVRVEFKMLKLGFMVVFYRPYNQLNTTEKMSNDQLNVGKDVGLGVGKDVGLNGTQEKIISCMLENPVVTALQISEKIGLSKRRVESNISTLKKIGIVIRNGGRKDGYWEVIR